MKATVLTLLVLATAAVLAQTPAAVVPCRVLAAADSTPLRRARITAIVDGRLPHQAFSDDEGRCGISISPDASMLRVSKAGYAPQDVRVGPRPPATFEIRLAPAVVISGRVTDSRGQAAVRVVVTIRRVEPRDAPQPAETAVRTDDRGEYRLGNLVAGRYAVHSQMSDTVVVDADNGQQPDVALIHNAPSVSFPYEEGGVVTGTLFDEHGEPAEGARVVLLPVADSGMGGVPAEAVTDDRGQFRVFHVPPGPHLVVVTHATESKAPLGGQTLVRVFGAAPEPGAYLPVYYPGKLDPGEAVPLQVERGQELQAIDMVVPMARGSRVFGSISSHSALRTPLELRPVDRSAAARTTNRLATVSADGRFELPNVAPGTYVLQHVSTETIEPSGLDNVMFASLRIAVGGEDVGPLTLTSTPTSSIRGNVTLEGGTASVEANQFRLTILPVDAAEAPAASVIARASKIEPDWTFRIAGLATASRIGLTRAPPGWWLKSVTVGAVNAAEEPAPFGSPDDSRNDVGIVLSRNGATLVGRVIDDRQQPVDLYNVIVFATDRRRWFEGSGFIKTAVPRSDGRFTVTSLPPGDYFVGAIEYSENNPDAGDILQPDALSRLARSARRISIGEGEQQSAELRLIRLPR